MEALVSRHHQGTKKVSVTGAGLTYRNVKIQSLYGSWEKQGFVKVAVSRAASLTRVSVRRVSTDCIVPFIIPGCYLWHWRSWCQGRWTYGWNEQVHIILLNYTSIIIILCHSSPPFDTSELQWCSLLQMQYTGYYMLQDIQLRSKCFALLFTHTSMELWSQNISKLLLVFYTLDSYGSWKTWKVM